MLLPAERCAPSILITFINMVLFRENEAEAVLFKDTPEEVRCEKYLYAGEREFQSLLVPML